ncbi:EthD family reductase [Bosea sp. (in: a-proteobacteria)]|uniref:EthD family reductase n=1 Tax=Bosea sp. (in: a-proteobacteria) TaxID=1871050 RepID=UPI002FCA5FC6
MFKRMSILERRPGDDQAFFSRHWQERHGPLVARLPLVRAYVQNHVEEEYAPTGFRVGGIVELQFDDPAAMESAFSATASLAVAADEVNFLGHAAGYVIGDAPIRLAGRQGKLVIVAAHGGNQVALGRFEAALRALPDFVELIRDEVASVMARPGATRPSQGIDAFLHVYFADAASARRAGPQVAALVEDALKLGVFHVRTVRIV